MKKEKKKKAKATKKKAKAKIKEEYVDFLYIDEVDKKIFKKKNIYVDPGKRSLFYMIDDDGNKLDYTNRRRIKETKRLKYQRLIENHKKRLSIMEIEQELNDYNSRTCDLNKFKAYMKKKNEINKKLFEKYKDPKFRQYRWYSYINRKRSEDRMLNLIQKQFGKEINIIMGDASLGKNMRNFISTPNIALKRKLKERFSVYHIDEFRTSCLHYKTEEKCDNLHYVDKKKKEKLKIQLKQLLKEKRNEENANKITYIGKYLDGKDKTRKLHSVLTYKMENNRLGCINRDLNACMNIKKLFKHYLKNGDRPLRYQRSYDLETTSNHESSSNGCKLSGVQLSKSFQK